MLVLAGVLPGNFAGLRLLLNLAACHAHVGQGEGIDRGCIDEALPYLAGINADTTIIDLLGLLIRRAQQCLPRKQALALVSNIST